MPVPLHILWSIFTSLQDEWHVKSIEHTDIGGGLSGSSLRYQLCHKVCPNDGRVLMVGSNVNVMAVRWVDVKFESIVRIGNGFRRLGQLRSLPRRRKAMTAYYYCTVEKMHTMRGRQYLMLGKQGRWYDTHQHHTVSLLLQVSSGVDFIVSPRSTKL